MLNSPECDRYPRAVSSYRRGGAYPSQATRHTRRPMTFQQSLRPAPGRCPPLDDPGRGNDWSHGARRDENTVEGCRENALVQRTRQLWSVRRHGREPPPHHRPRRGHPPALSSVRVEAPYDSALNRTLLSDGSAQSGTPRRSMASTTPAAQPASSTSRRTSPARIAARHSSPPSLGPSTAANWSASRVFISERLHDLAASASAGAVRHNCSNASRNTASHGRRSASDNRRACRRRSHVGCRTRNPPVFISGATTLQLVKNSLQL